MSAQLLHGGRLDEAIAAHGGDRSDWLDLSTGINPVGYPVKSPDNELWRRLPDSRAENDLMAAARAAYGVPEQYAIVAANGTQALIELLPRLIGSQNIDIVSPTYDEHELCWLKAGRHVERIGGLDQLSVLSNCTVVVNPNNPDGRVFSTDQLMRLSDEMKQRHGYLIIDEAFCDAAPELSVVPHMQPNMLVYRSVGKFYGLAGMRLGFLMGDTALVQQARNQLGPWNVSAPALEIGRQALEDQAWQSATREWLSARSGALAELLEDCGLKIMGTNALFVFAEHKAAGRIHEMLLDHHVLVRRFSGMPDKLRFGLCASDDDEVRLRRALNMVMAGL